jgi:hypothetical protein
MGQREEYAIWLEGPPSVHLGYQSAMDSGSETEPEQEVARDLLASAQAQGISVLDALSRGFPVPRTADRRLLTCYALEMEAEQTGGDNPVGGLPLHLTASPASGLAQLDALSQFSDSSGSDKGSTPDTPPASNLANPGVGGKVGATAYPLRTGGT